MIKSKFDLFKLHQKVDEYGSMSYIIVKGKDLGKLVLDIIWKVVQKNKINKKILLQRISKKIGVSYSTLERQTMKLRNHSYWISLAFLKELLKEYKCCFHSRDINRIKHLLIDSFEKIKISNGHSLELNTVKELSEDLCVLVGAHAADGCLHRKKIGLHYHYQILIVDSDYKTIEWYKNHMYTLFGLKTRINKLKGCYTIQISNKIIFRYFNLFFGFPIGKKSNKVREPKIIKCSNFDYRKAFVKGFMTFDGSVTTFGSVSLGVKSKYLIKSVKNILNKDKIEIIFSFNKKYDVWFLRTSTRLDKIQLNKWLDYFIPNTKKYIKIYNLLNGFQIKPKDISQTIKAFDREFPYSNSSKIRISDILNVMIHNKSLFTWEIRDKLVKEKKLTSLSYTPIKMYLQILEKQANIIKSEIKEVGFNKGYSNSTLYYLNSIFNWRIP